MSMKKAEYQLKKRKKKRLFSSFTCFSVKKKFIKTKKRMNPELGEFRDFPEAFVLVNDDGAHRFSSSIHGQNVNQLLTDLPGVNDSSNIKSFDINQIKNLTKKFKYLEIESKRAQQITTNFEK